MGFEHFGFSQQTDLPMEERKAHRFVATNLEVVARRIIAASGIEPKYVESLLKAITRQAADFRRQNARAKGKAPEFPGGPPA
jgi:hypothetical protein